MSQLKKDFSSKFLSIYLIIKIGEKTSLCPHNQFLGYMLPEPKSFNWILLSYYITNSTNIGIDNFAALGIHFDVSAITTAFVLFMYDFLFLTEKWEFDYAFKNR